MTDYPNNIPAKLEIIKASEITPKEVRWLLWYPYIPFGKVTLLQDDPGDGKSKLMLSLAALLSKGAPLPFADEDESGEPMTVIYQTTEDDADDTVVPRFNSAGGDGDRLIFIKEDEKSLTFGDDRIREAVEKYHAKLLILDPMSSYIGDTCSMNNANETRAEFNHLIAVAKDTGCAIVIIAHMNKAKDTSPLYRTNGSIDIAGAARSILAVTRTSNKQNPAERYLVQVKSNLAPMGSANEQHPKPSYGDRKCRTDFRIRIYDQGRQGVSTLCRLFLYSQQLCKNIPSTAEAPKPDGEQENQYTAHNPEAANNNCTWEFNAKPYYCCKQRTRDVVSDP